MKYKVKLLGDIFKITSGGTPSRQNNDYYTNGTVPWVKTGDLKTKYLSQVSENITRLGLENSSAKIFPKGTVLIAMYGATIGNCSVLNIEAATNQACAALLPSKEVIPEYLYYFLLSIREDLIRMGVGGAQPNISATMLKQIPIPLPPIETQKKIAYILDKAQEIIDKRKEQIEKLDELVQSVFSQMFGKLPGRAVPLSSVCWINPSKSEIVNMDDYTKVTFLPMANVTENGNINVSEERSFYEVRNGFTYFKEGDVLFAKITPCMENGKGAIARGLQNGIGFGSTEFHVLRPHENISSEWLYHLTKTMTFRRKAEKSMTGSAGQKRVPKQFFDSYNIVIPPIDLQNKFAQIVEKTEQQKLLMQQSLTEMENNFNSIMQKAFRGELF